MMWWIIGGLVALIAILYFDAHLLEIGIPRVLNPLEWEAFAP